MQKIDVIYPLGGASKFGDNWEIRYSIRSLVSYFPQLGNIYVIGVKPDWLSDEAIFIESRDSYVNNKAASMICRIIKGCERLEISQFILRCSDDHILLGNLEGEELVTPYFEDDWFELDENYQNLKDDYLERCRNTFDELRKRRLTTYKYDIHIPELICKKDYKLVMNQYDWENKKYIVNSLYYNTIVITKHNYIGNRLIKFHQHNGYSVNKLMELISGKLYLNFNNRGLTHNLKEVIEKLFPEKSKFESD